MSRRRRSRRRSRCRRRFGEGEGREREERVGEEGGVGAKGVRVGEGVREGVE